MYSIIRLRDIDRAKEIARKYSSTVSYEVIEIKAELYAVVQCSSIAAMILIDRELGVKI